MKVLVGVAVGVRVFDGVKVGVKVDVGVRVGGSGELVGLRVGTITGGASVGVLVAA